MAAEKRTELMMKLLDAKIKFERCIRICRERALILKSDACLRRWHSHIPGIEKCLKEVEKRYKTIERFTGILGPVRLEKLMPFVSGLLKKVEVIEFQIVDLEKMCLSCVTDKLETCENTSAATLPT